MAPTQQKAAEHKNKLTSPAEQQEDGQKMIAAPEQEKLTEEYVRKEEY